LSDSDGCLALAYHSGERTGVRGQRTRQSSESSRACGKMHRMMETCVEAASGVELVG
jgi:hypothetical protein